MHGWKREESWMLATMTTTPFEDAFSYGIIVGTFLALTVFIGLDRWWR